LADRGRVQLEVSSCRRLLEEHGIECSTTADDLIAWFNADTAYPDISLDELLGRPLLVVHELVEISEVKKMGLKLTKDVILKNPEAVDRAHCLATLAELKMAVELGDVEHVRSRMRSIESWISDPMSTDECKAEYARIHGLAKKIIETGTRD
jgi:hypothetical protein